MGDKSLKLKIYIFWDIRLRKVNQMQLTNAIDYCKKKKNIKRYNSAGGSNFNSTKNEALKCPNLLPLHDGG